MTTSANSVEVRDLAVSFSSLRVLHNLTLSVGQGEFVVLLGPSGCGKSTLLNAIAGLQDISGGQVLIDGVDVTDKPPKDRGIGMVFQSYALYPRMTVAQNLGFALRMAGMHRSTIATRISEVARLLQLEDLLARRPSELSGGQRQRVAIGRALVRRAKVFLFDEPLSNLDAQLRAVLRVEIKKLHMQLGNTMIYVTHDQVEAMTLADRIVVMRQGVVQQIGTPTEVYSKPANRFVAGFIGSPAMSFVAGHFVARDGSLAFVAGEQEINCSAYKFASGAPAAGQPAVLGLRPEHLALGNGDTSGSGWFDGKVMFVEPTGADQIVWSRLGGQDISLRVTTAEPIMAGAPIQFRPTIERASFFGEDGARL